MAFYTVGRFQPPTLGHVRMIREMLTLANGRPAFVFISSAKDSLIPSKMKKEYLTKMLTGEGNLQLIDTAECETPCGGPLGGWAYLKERGMVGPDVVLVVGSDQAPKFDPKTARMWGTVEEEERPSIQSIERGGKGVTGFSSTKAREAVASSGASGLTPFLTDGSNAISEQDVARMAKALLAVQSKWKGGSEEEETVLGEIDGGRRRRKTMRNKASSKALYRRGSRSRNGSSKTSRSSYGLQGY